MKRYKAKQRINDKTIYFNEYDIVQTINKPEWQDEPITVINIPDEPDSLTKIMLLKDAFDLYIYTGGEWIKK